MPYVTQTGASALACLVAALVGLAACILQCLREAHELSQPRRCIATVEGVVVGYSPYEHAGQVWLPQVRYAVGAAVYQVTGPVFLYYLTSSKPSTRLRLCRTPINTATRQDLPLACRLVLTQGGAGKKGGSVADLGARLTSHYDNPNRNTLGRLYPLGSRVSVHYDPGDPSSAFVERYCPRPLRIVCPLALSVLCMVCAVWALTYV